jgi:hypothetical protein
MTIQFSVLNKYKSLIGFQIERNGALRKDENDSPVFQSMVEVSIGFIFGYVSVKFDLGSAKSIDKMITEYKDML